MDPTIRMQKCLAPEWARIKTHHPRLPDIGTGILVTVRPSPGESEEYYGVYLGHGQSKTAFELKSYECNQNLRFDVKVLKVSRKQGHGASRIYGGIQMRCGDKHSVRRRRRRRC